MDTPAKNHERGMANKPLHAGTLQQPMLIRGHTHARPEPRPTGLCKHPQHARYMKNLTLQNPTLISRNAPATKDARVIVMPTMVGAQIRGAPLLDLFFFWPVH
jgi:hypothetical protein